VKILVVDDEPDVVKLISLSFRMQQPNAEVLGAPDGASALELLARERPDVVLLDVGLPDMDGFEVLKEIRRFSDVPVIMLTARGNELDKVTGLEQGADDYITKPYGDLELRARVRAVLRRMPGSASTPVPPFSSGDITVDFNQREVRVRGAPVQLTTTEYNLLSQLVRHAGQVLTHETLLARVWGREYVDEIEYLKVYIRRLRAKLEPDPRRPRYIMTEHGVGYWFKRA